MNPLYFLIGALIFLALLFFSFIALLWGLRQLLIIRNQNDTVIYFLEQNSMNVWNEAYTQAGLEENMEGRLKHPGMKVRAA